MIDQASRKHFFHMVSTSYPARTHRSNMSSSSEAPESRSNRYEDGRKTIIETNYVLKWPC